MKRYDLIIVGAGPAGLSAAIEAAKRGLNVVVFDENEKPGGQLFKQIHKFFGSKEHKAKVRGFVIGEQLLQESADAGVKVVLNATVVGMYLDKEIVVRIGDEVHHYKGDSIIIATGASENMVTFEGWNLPGVIGAGAAQTMMNLHGVKPGEKILMLGSGNVGLVVSFQLMQCGCDVVALVDAAPRVGGYGVHAAKVARTGVPFYLSHTIVKAEGEDHVTGVTIAEVDEHFQFIPGPDDDMIICRCEEVTRGEIRRYLRTGMGLCQGQTCAKLVKGIVARELGVSPAELEPATSRAPIRPIEMRVFAAEAKEDGEDEE